MDYNLNEIKKLDKNDFVQWYFKEMKKLYPLAKAFIDYTINDAEFSYNQLHEININ